MIAPEPRTGNGAGRDPDRAMKAKFAILKREIGEARAYRMASEAVGRVLVPGFGLTTCTREELIKILDMVTGKGKLETGRRASRDRGQFPASSVQHPRRADGEARVSLAQTRLETNLEQELRLSSDQIRGFFARATGKEFSSTMRDHSKYIAAMQSYKRRMLRAARDEAAA